MAQSKTENRILDLFVFITGGAIMGLELLAGKMLSSVYGSIVSVWTIVISITMLTLALSYYFGGRMADKYPRKHYYISSVYFGAILMAILPFLFNVLQKPFIEQNFYSGLVLFSLIILVPPLLFLGISSPYVIRLKIDALKNTGNIAGQVFGLSTVAGIFFTFLVGFYLLPETGATTASLLLSLLLFVPALLYLLIRKFYRSIWLSLPLLLVLGLLVMSSKEPVRPGQTLVYKTDGLLGQLKVIDMPIYVNNYTIPRRILLNNHIGQTIINIETGHSLWDYPHLLGKMLGYYPEGAEVLLLGAGGGAMIRECRELGLKVDVVELDERMEALTRNYFYPQFDISFIVDDARHFLNTTPKKYDVIIFDVYGGESPPYHLFSLENFEKVKAVLRPGGAIFINFNGFWQGDKGLASRSLAKTLLKAGYGLKVMPTFGDELNRSIEFIASLDGFSQFKNNNPRINECCTLWNIPSFPYSILEEEDLSSLDDAYILSDNYPILEKLNIPVGLLWRQNAFKLYLK